MVGFSNFHPGQINRVRTGCLPVLFDVVFHHNKRINKLNQSDFHHFLLPDDDETPTWQA
jgi:hypothetical protein